MSHNLPGLSREDEERRLKEILEIAEERFAGKIEEVKNLEAQLHVMQQEFDESDKEQQALWHNTDARFMEASQELRRSSLARRKPYFGRIDIRDPQVGKEEALYIGKSVIARDPAHPEVIDWRAPIASVYYDSSLGETSYSVKGEGKFEITLNRKRTYEIEDDLLKDFYDSDVVANDELLTKYLAKNKKAVLGEIIATIQQEQNSVIRKKPQHNMIIQGAAGSGKTTVAMHRISYVLYNYELEFQPADFYVIGSNQVLLNYITGVLPDLNVYGVSQMTMEQLFVRLLYEDWDKKKYRIKPVVKGVTEPVKGSMQWFRDLEEFCREYEWSVIPRGDVRIEKNHARLLSGDTIERLLKQFDRLSRADKITMLTERLMAKLENEVCGKYYSYTAEEKKSLNRYYSTYFGKREWKGSIYEFYNDFLEHQAQKGMKVINPQEAFDVYDLAALAYIYKRLKETEIIREAGHVVIDEAQDFGMMAYGALKYCLSTCTYTIMGDVSQNIFMDYGLNDWQELRELMLPGEFDYFGLLRKSYRNTVEISDFATEILHHGSFQVYPVQPIIRHGEGVKIIGCENDRELAEKTAEIIGQWQDKGMETIAVICRDQEQAEGLREQLTGKVDLLTGRDTGMEFGSGVMVLPLELTKGLEFDAVMIYDASRKNYPAEDGEVKRLYVAATRALHELTVLYQGKLTDLIATAAPEEKKRQAITEDTKPERKPLPPREEKTRAQEAKERADRGESEKAERKSIGPKPIVVGRTPRPLTAPGTPAGTGRSQGTGKAPGTPAAGTGGPSGTGKAPGMPAGTGRSQGTGSTVTPGKRPGVGKVDVVVPGRASAAGAAFGGRGRTEPAHVYSGNDLPRDPYRLPTYYEQQKAETIGQRRKETSREITKRTREFGGMPEQQELKVPGHSRIDCSVKLCMKGKNAIDVLSAYGTLHLEVLAPDVVRVCFQKGSGVDFGSALGEFAGKSAPFKHRDSRECLEITTEKLQIRVNKRDGALHFLGTGGRELLSEREKEPRQVETNGSWSFFRWNKKEELFARTPDGKAPVGIGQSAKYVSYGGESDEMPGLVSAGGYELRFPAGRRTMCCNIAMYGPYLFQEGNGLEYYFRVL